MEFPNNTTIKESQEASKSINNLSNINSFQNYNSINNQLKNKTLESDENVVFQI